MMKTKLLLFFVGIFSLMMLTSCSDDEDNSPFVGKWQLTSIGDGDMIIDPSTYNIPQFYTFYSNKRVKWGDVEEKYSYDDQTLYFNYTATHETKTYSYSFSDNNTLMLKLTKQDMGDVHINPGSRFSLINKIQVLKRIE